MDLMTESGTEKRIDDLRDETHQGFNRLDADVREARSSIGAVRSDISSLQRLMIGFFATTLGSIVAGVVVTVLMSHH